MRAILGSALRRVGGVRGVEAVESPRRQAGRGSIIDREPDGNIPGGPADAHTGDHHDVLCHLRRARQEPLKDGLDPRCDEEKANSVQSELFHGRLFGAFIAALVNIQASEGRVTNRLRAVRQRMETKYVD